MSNKIQMLKCQSYVDIRIGYEIATGFALATTSSDCHASLAMTLGVKEVRKDRADVGKLERGLPRFARNDIGCERGSQRQGGRRQIGEGIATLRSQ
jgi:hypothetical protein